MCNLGLEEWNWIFSIITGISLVILAISSIRTAQKANLIASTNTKLTEIQTKMSGKQLEYETKRSIKDRMPIFIVESVELGNGGAVVFKNIGLACGRIDIDTEEMGNLTVLRNEGNLWHRNTDSILKINIDITDRPNSSGDDHFSIILTFYCNGSRYQQKFNFSSNFGASMSDPVELKKPGIA